MENLTRILLLVCFAVLSGKRWKVFVHIRPRAHYFWFVIPVSCHPEGSDLTGSVFTFPTLGRVDHVTLTPAGRKPLSQASLCLRFYTDQTTQSPCFFSLATATFTNAFLLCRMKGGFFRIHVGTASADFTGFTYNLNGWNSVCVTWDEEDVSQFFINGQASVRKLTLMRQGWKIPTDHLIIVGQDQDRYGGGFQTKNAFIGHLTDVHMWDHVISPCAVQQFMDELSIQPGNYLNWQSLKFETHGRAKVEKKQLLLTGKQLLNC